MSSPLTLLWLRRDLRLHDHCALFQALQDAGAVQPVFVFDTDILRHFPNSQDRRLPFIARALLNMDREFRKRGGGLLLLHGSASTVIPQLAQATRATRIIAAEDYEPGARTRDAAVAKAVSPNASLQLVKDQLIFSPTEILKGDGTPYKVYTPYAGVWHARCEPISAAPYTVRDRDRYADP